ncbi:MAG: PKD domain-containing protein, partial [Bacteroidia bacterium]|nr:PKD domain-containing protein [Bacteroidia bacterium]
MGESVTFTSCSSKATRLEWDFGAGSAIEAGESVVHKFDKSGTYTVQTRAFAKRDKSSDRYSATIIVNEPKSRYLTKLEVTAFPQTKPNGSNWDGLPSTGNSVNPDLFIKLGLTASGFSAQTSEASNATQADLPLTYDLTPVGVKLTNQNWRVSLLDNDATAGVGGADTLFTTIINPSTAAASGGKISLSGNNVSLNIYFDEK